MADKIDAAQEDLTTALARFERNRADLSMPDGSPKYAPAVHDNLLAGAVRSLHDVAGELDEAVEEEVRTVQRLREAAEDDPITQLSDAELQKANLRAVFVQQDADHLTLPALAARLRGIIAAGNGKPDKVQAFLWSRYASLRVGAEAERRRRESPNAPLPTEVHVIEGFVSQLAAVVAPKSGISDAEAERRLRRAREARAEAHRRVREADGSQERLQAELAARYSL
jgi:hypothetical protein